MNGIQKNQWAAGMGLACIAAILWSGNYIVARALHYQITPISLAFFRWATATLVLFPFALGSVIKHKQLFKQHAAYLVVTALFGITLFNTFIYIAGKYSSAMNLAIIGTTAAPIFVILYAHFFLKERASVTQIAGIALCIIGLLLLISKGSLERLQQFAFTKGDFWILLAALAFAVYTIRIRKKPKEIPPIPFLFCLFALGTLLLAPAFIIDRVVHPGLAVTGNMVLVFLYLGIGASVGAFLCWNLAIQKIGSPSTALFGNLIPVFSTIEAILILHEDNNALVMGSMAVILTGLLIANYAHLKAKKG